MGLRAPALLDRPDNDKTGDRGANASQSLRPAHPLTDFGEPQWAVDPAMTKSGVGLPVCRYRGHQQRRVQTAAPGR
jgi:hypothetical protein